MVLHFATKLHWKQLAPDAVKSKCLSLQTMTSNGLISNSGKGFFTILPLGQRIIEKLTRIVDQELQAVGAQKMEAPSMAPKKIWSKSGRWESMGAEMFKLKDRLDIEYCLQPTAEEIFTMSVSSLGLVREKMLPLMLYQKYVRRVEADSGAMGGDVSHEFHLPNPSSEDSLLICKKCEKTTKKEEKEFSKCDSCGGEIERMDTIEVGHTFQLGKKYSEAFEAFSPTKEPFFMCCFGLGLTRIIAASIDTVTISKKAMRIPEVLAPFKLGIILPKESTTNSEFVKSFLKDIDGLKNFSNDILVDDRIEKSIGRRINEMNQLGIPNLIVASSHKHVDPFEIQKIELFKTKLADDRVLKIGDLTHSELFQFLNNYS
ncbi:hypothetical protein FO519_004443 [Halicephalobus sp. NKZ332]|nr:hypothetical protein FO519_004443 [Halicephalobus sp. NKZ332]